MKIALIQISTIEEQPEKNLGKIIDFTRQAKEKDANIIMFHEGTLTDYVSDVDKYAQEVPNGYACKKISQLANKLNVYISFGLIEKDGLNRYITQVFLGPNNFIYKYRKTWLYPTSDRIKAIRRHRDEPSDFDPGNGPEIFDIAGLKASCMICADAYAPRCLKLLKQLKPQIIFYPNNREMWRPNYLQNLAKQIEIPILVTNRVGKSWGEECEGGCSVYSSNGELLANANNEGKEEIVIFDLKDLNGVE
ncbi:carbon-nitrogen hydrolase family protein [Nanoarchaeota archaeon]